MEAGADLAADKLSQLPSEQLVAGFAHHARVFDIVAIAGYETTDGERIESRALGDELSCEIGGYHVAARREDAWDAIVAVLLSLDARHHGRFGELMSALRSLSNSSPEPDGLHPLLESRDQMMFDVASERERRRERARLRVTRTGPRIPADVAQRPSGGRASAESDRTRVLSLDRRVAEAGRGSRPARRGRPRSGGAPGRGRRVAGAGAAGSAHRRAGSVVEPAGAHASSHAARARARSGRVRRAERRARLPGERADGRSCRSSRGRSPRRRRSMRRSLSAIWDSRDRPPCRTNA